jgi:hypothetical protein
VNVKIRMSYGRSPSTRRTANTSRARRVLEAPTRPSMGWREISCELLESATWLLSCADPESLHRDSAAPELLAVGAFAASAPRAGVLLDELTKTHQ